MQNIQYPTLDKGILLPNEHILSLRASAMADHTWPALNRSSSVETEDTCEGPEVDESSPVRSAYFTLIPFNAEAKLAFSQVAQWIKDTAQPAEDHPERLHASKYIWIASEKIRDADVKSLLIRARAPQSSPPLPRHQRDPSRTPTRFWTGCYYLHLEVPPKTPQLGWTLGPQQSDLVLDYSSNNNTTTAPEITQPFYCHAALQIAPDSGQITLCSSDPRVRIQVQNSDSAYGSNFPIGRDDLLLRFGPYTYFALYTRNSSEGSDGYETHLARLGRYTANLLGLTNNTLDTNSGLPFPTP